MKKLIGYVGTNDLKTLQETDILCLDVINIAFAQIEEGTVRWEHPECKAHLARIKRIHPDIKLVLSIGGWGAGGFSEAAREALSRKKLADSAVEVMRAYKLDGIDIDWEYPCFDVAQIGADFSDKDNYTYLLQEIRERLEIEKKGAYLLTTAVGGDAYFCRCTKMDQVQQYVDYVQLMTYDLRGGFQTLTGHHTNLYANPVDLFEASTKKAVDCYLAAGVPREKMVIGAAFYSREWRGVVNQNHGLHQMAETTGGYGPAYHTLVSEYIDKNGYTRYWDKEAKAPYLFNGEHFISYEDKESIQWKARYVKEEELLGMMYWEYCGDLTHELTPWMREQLDEL
ncbi:MAG: chitinase [Clostridiales bacterium]|nr:chitinase [Clostridiales bacterium]